jgi:hypothetical protein
VAAPAPSINTDLPVLPNVRGRRAASVKPTMAGMSKVQALRLRVEVDRPSRTSILRQHGFLCILALAFAARGTLCGPLDLHKQFEMDHMPEAVSAETRVNPACLNRSTQNR